MNTLLNKKQDDFKKAVTESLADVKAGRVISIDEARKRLRIPVSRPVRYPE